MMSSEARNSAGSGQEVPSPTPRIRLLHSIDLLDGRVLEGDTDRRGSEEALLGGEKFWGLRVIEVGPGSVWLSAHLAARCSEYTALDLPATSLGNADEVRAGWQHVMQSLGLRPAVIADTAQAIVEQPLGYDVALSYGALSRAEDPLGVLRRMAELSDDTIVVIEPVEASGGDEFAGARLTMAQETSDPYGARWVFSPALLERLLTQTGFERQVLTRHAAAHNADATLTIVARRAARRPSARPGQARRAAEPATPPQLKRDHSPDLDAAAELPLPPPADRRAATGTADVEVFITVGRNVFEQMVQALARNGIAAGQAGRVLDFGCGLSRVLRWWRMFPNVDVYGTDLDVAAVMWNRERLGYGTFAFNTLDPKLDYPPNSFDLVHAMGVMSHLPEHLQIVWFKELLRILRPGGLLYFTSRGRSCRALLPPDLQAVFDDHRLVCGGAEQAGTEACVAFHPPQWVVNTLLPATGAEIVELAEHPTGSPGEDCWLLRKPLVAGQR